MTPVAASLDAAARLALAEFDLGPVLAVAPLPAGSPAACEVVTSNGAFVLKPAA